MKQTAIPKNVKKIIKNEECDDPSSLLLQHKTALYPPLSHSSPPPSLLLRRSFISESSDSLHGQRFPTFSTVNRRRWFRLRPSFFSGFFRFFRFIRHRFPLPVLSPQGNATSAFEWSACCCPLRSGGLSDFNHLIPFMEWFQSSAWRLYDHACLCGIFGTNVRWICEFVCAWLLSLMHWCIVWWLLMFLFMDCW